MLKSDAVLTISAFKQGLVDGSCAKRAELKLTLALDNGIGLLKGV